MVRNKVYLEEKNGMGERSWAVQKDVRKMLCNLCWDLFGDKKSWVYSLL